VERKINQSINPDREHLEYVAQVLQDRCYSCYPTNMVKTLKKTPSTGSLPVKIIIFAALLDS